jgi:hypothetical protein
VQRYCGWTYDRLAAIRTTPVRLGYSIPYNVDGGQLSRTGTKKSPQQRAKDILANCHESPHLDGCLLWQGPVDEDGYGYVKVNGKRTRVHRIVALYGVDRTEEQIAELARLRIGWDCGIKACMRQGSGHMRFRTSKPEKVYESSEDLMSMYVDRLQLMGYAVS